MNARAIVVFVGLLAGAAAAEYPKPEEKPSPVEGMWTTFVGGPAREDGWGGNQNAVYAAGSGGDTYFAGITASLGVGGATVEHKHSWQGFVAKVSGDGGVA